MSDDQPVTDGGEPSAGSSPFDVTAEYEETARDKAEKWYDAWIRAPIAIIWTDWRARIGFTIVLAYLIMGVVGPRVVEPTGTLDAVRPPGGYPLPPFQEWSSPLGSNTLGEDLFAQTVHSTPAMLKMVLAGAVSTVGIGTIVGAIAGYKGGMTDTVLSSITDIFINIPGFPLVMVLTLLLRDVEVFGISLLTGNPYSVGVILSVAAWGGLARAIRSQVLTLRQEEFVEASRALGLPTRSIVFRDIVPHLMPYIVINLTNAGRRVIFEATALYYLGILTTGENWGVMLNAAANHTPSAFNLSAAPELFHWALVPLLTIVILSMGLILLGQSLDRVFNPRVRARHEKTAGDAEGEIEEGGDVGGQPGGF